MVQSVAMPACMERLTVSPASFSLFRFSLEPPSPQANAVERSPQALLACHTHRSVHLARLGLGVMAKAWISSQLPQRVSLSMLSGHLSSRQAKVMAPTTSVNLRLRRPIASSPQLYQTDVAVAKAHRRLKHLKVRCVLCLGRAISEVAHRFALWRPKRLLQSS